jgi:AraC-like DNA-binding protein
VLALHAVSEASRINNPDALAYSQVILAGIYLTEIKYDTAAYYLNLADIFYKNIQNNINKGYFYYTLAKLKLSQKKYHESILTFNKAISLAENKKDYVLLGCIYLCLADCSKELNKKKELLTNLDKAEYYFNKSNDPLVVGPQLIGIGIHYADLGLSDKANIQFIKSVQMCELTADSLFLGYLYTNISIIYAGHGQVEKADEYFNKSMKVFRNIRNDRAIAYNLNLKGMDYISRKKYKEAVSLLIEAGTLKKEAKDWQGACFVYSNLTEVYTHIGNSAKATLALKEAEEMCVKAGDKLSLAAFLQSKGKYHALLKDYPKALEAFEQSLSIAKEIAVQEIAEQNLLSISEIYQAKGDAGEALRYYKIYTSARDSVLQASRTYTMAETLAKYETDKKDTQIKALINSKLKSERGRYFVVGNVIAVILLLFVAIVFFFRLKGNYTERLQFLLTIREQVNHQREKALDLFIPIQPDRASKPMLTSELQSGLWLHLQDLMENEKLFLHNDLSMAELARRLNTNTTYLSKVINDITHQNFSNYLNQYRIEEACRLLSEPQSRNFTIEAIAQSVGFKSKSAFNTAFRKIKSATPSEFLVTQSEESEQLA